MTATQCNCDHARLGPDWASELDALRSLRVLEVPDDSMDYDATVVIDYPTRQERARELQGLLARAVVDEEASGGGVAARGTVPSGASPTPAFLKPLPKQTRL